MTAESVAGLNRRAGRVVAALAVVLAYALVVPADAAAALAPRISVSATSGLNPDGQQITVHGVGFDEYKGIYVAVCVDNGPGEVPTPCIGGADTGGTGSGSAWISSNPPSYGEGLAQPYDPGGAFTVTLLVVARDPVNGTDCRQVQCAVVTRADHTRPADRSQDTRVPISFAAAPPAPTTPPPTTTAAPPPTSAPTPPANTESSAPPSETPTTQASEPTSDPATEPVADTSDSDDSGLGWWLAGAAALLVAGVGGLVARHWLRRRTGTSEST